MPLSPEKKSLFSVSLVDSVVPAAPEGIVPAGNHATGTLKLIALFFMIIDHLGAVVFTNVPEMRLLGRIAFPIYCWCMVVGFHYTRSIPRYLMRILAVGLISQPLYATAMNHVLTKPNIFLTLFLALLGLWGIRENKYGSRIWAPILVVYLGTVLDVDYGWKGVLFLMLLYAARGSRPAIAAVMISFFLFWGTSYSITNSLFGISFDLNGPVQSLMISNQQTAATLVRGITQPLSAFMRMETYGLLSLFFILIRFRKNLKYPVWVGYALYPAHLLLIMLAKAIFR